MLTIRSDDEGGTIVVSGPAGWSRRFRPASKHKRRRFDSAPCRRKKLMRRLKLRQTEESPASTQNSVFVPFCSCDSRPNQSRIRDGTSLKKKPALGSDHFPSVKHKLCGHVGHIVPDCRRAFAPVETGRPVSVTQAHACLMGATCAQERGDALARRASLMRATVRWSDIFPECLRERSVWGRRAREGGRGGTPDTCGRGRRWKSARRETRINAFPPPKLLLSKTSRGVR